MTISKYSYGTDLNVIVDSQQRLISLRYQQTPLDTVVNLEFYEDKLRITSPSSPREEEVILLSRAAEKAGEHNKYQYFGLPISNIKNTAVRDIINTFTFKTAENDITLKSTKSSQDGLENSYSIFITLPDKTEISIRPKLGLDITHSLFETASFWSETARKYYFDIKREDILNGSLNAHIDEIAKKLGLDFHQDLLSETFSELRIHRKYKKDQNEVDVYADTMLYNPYAAISKLVNSYEFPLQIITDSYKATTQLSKAASYEACKVSFSGLNWTERDAFQAFAQFRKLDEAENLNNKTKGDISL